MKTIYLCGTGSWRKELMQKVKDVNFSDISDAKDEFHIVIYGIDRFDYPCTLTIACRAVERSNRHPATTVFFYNKKDLGKDLVTEIEKIITSTELSNSFIFDDLEDLASFLIKECIYLFKNEKILQHHYTKKFKIALTDRIQNLFIEGFPDSIPDELTIARKIKEVNVTHQTVRYLLNSQGSNLALLLKVKLVRAYKNTPEKVTNLIYSYQLLSNDQIHDSFYYCTQGSHPYLYNKIRIIREEVLPWAYEQLRLKPESD